MGFSFKIQNSKFKIYFPHAAALGRFSGNSEKTYWQVLGISVADGQGIAVGGRGEHERCEGLFKKK